MNMRGSNLPGGRLVVITALLTLFFLFAFFKPTKIILNQERGVELSDRYVMVA